MSLVLDALGAGAVLMLLALLYLSPFERGTSYRTSSPVHELDDSERLRILASLLAVPSRPGLGGLILRWKVHTAIRVSDSDSGTC